MTEIWHSLADVPPDFGGTIATLGNFDGVHRGHQAVLRQMVADARAEGLRAVAITFDPHPRQVHQPDESTRLITGLADRLDCMSRTGLNAILVQHYTLEFAQQSPEEFVRTYFVEGLNAARVVVGKDARFGRGNSGDVTTLEAIADQLGFTVEVIDTAHGPVEGDDRTWSSSWVRGLLREGHVAAAAEVLGRLHRVRGAVVRGKALGREIGFPTANIDVTAGMVPAAGVYAGWFAVAGAGERLPAAVSVGVNTTVGAEDATVEAHVLGVDTGDIYGREVTLDFVDFRRPMLDFGSLERLQEAIAEDIVWARGALGVDR